MTSEKVQQIINKIIETNRTRIGGKAARKQYSPAKHQIASLTELGIIDLMPAGFGHSDASVVIAEAQRGESAVLDANYEGSAIASSELYDALNEVEEVVETSDNEENTKMDTYNFDSIKFDDNGNSPTVNLGEFSGRIHRIDDNRVQVETWLHQRSVSDPAIQFIRQSDGWVMAFSPDWTSRREKQVFPRITATIQALVS